MTSSHKGRRTRRFKMLTKTLRAKGLPCWLCGQPIDYNAKAGEPKSFSADHKEPLSKRPDLAEVYSNLRPAHFECNDKKGTGVAIRADRLLGRNSARW